MKQEVGFVSPAQSVSELDVRSRPTGIYVVVFIDANKKAGAEQCDKRGGLRLINGGLDVALHLAR